MALSQAVRAPDSPAGTTLSAPHQDWRAPPLSALLAVLVAGPWLAQGFLFGTDWPGPRRFDWPSELSAQVPIRATLVALSAVIGAQATGKVLVMGVLFAAALLAYRSVQADGFVPRTAAATIYVLNPFVFGRLHYGQLFLLAGYAVMPWVLIRVRKMIRQPTWRAGGVLGVSMSLVAAFTVHLFLVSAVMSAISLAAHALAAAERVQYTRRVVVAVLASAATTTLLCSYWVVPLVLGRSSEAAVIRATGSGELNAYATVPDPNLGLFPNLVGLYGFWAEDTGRFTSMKAFVPGWPLVLALLLSVCALGAVVTFRQTDTRLRPWAAGLIISAAVALIFEAGVSSPFTSGLVRWIDSTVPLYRGMRDAGKWAALLALAYSQLFALGVAAILGQIQLPKLRSSELDWLRSAAIGLIIAVPLYYGNGLLYGMHGEIQPSQYPSGWYAADRLLVADPHPGRTLFLPWHEYMSYDFVRNENKVVASPAPTFFSVPIVVSADPEVAGIAPPSDPEQAAISDLVRAGPNGQWARLLAAQGIKYVLLAHELDWATYAYLDRQDGLVKLADFGSVAMFRVQLP